jgi:hypothetical protein
MEKITCWSLIFYLAAVDNRRFDQNSCQVDRRLEIHPFFIAVQPTPRGTIHNGLDSRLRQQCRIRPKPHTRFLGRLCVFRLMRGMEALDYGSLLANPEWLTPGDLFKAGMKIRIFAG